MYCQLWPAAGHHFSSIWSLNCEVFMCRQRWGIIFRQYAPWIGMVIRVASCSQLLGIICNQNSQWIVMFICFASCGQLRGMAQSGSRSAKAESPPPSFVPWEPLGPYKWMGIVLMAVVFKRVCHWENFGQRAAAQHSRIDRRGRRRVQHRPAWRGGSFDLFGMPLIFWGQISTKDPFQCHPCFFWKDLYTLSVSC